MDNLNIHHRKSKPNDLNVIWRGVYFAPSVETIKNELKDKAKFDYAKKLQQEKTSKMYEIFGSGKGKPENPLKNKTHTKLMSYLSDKDSEDLETLEKAKSNLKKSDSIKTDIVIKRRMSNSSINQSVDIRLRPMKISTPVNNLNIIFQQNKPGHYFGIRKPKIFETPEDKEKEHQKLNIHNELVINLMNKQKTDSDAKDSSRRGSSIIQRLSMQLTTMAVDELRDRFVDINKTHTGNIKQCSSVHEDLMDILTKLAKDSIIDKYHLLKLVGYQTTKIPDLNDKINKTRIMELFVNKYYKMKHPLRAEIVKSIPETETEHKIIKHCILNNKVIYKLMNKRNFYPFKLQMKMQEIDASLNVSQEDAASKATDQPVIKRNMKKIKGYSKIFFRSRDILGEICQDVKEFNGFYKPLIDFCFKNINDFKELENENSVDKIRKYIQGLSYTLTIHRNHPGSTARILTQQFIKVGETNSIVLNELINNVDGWLDQILKTFLSRFPSIRLEAFITVSLLFSKQIYIDAIQSHLFNDIMYDVLATILRCFDLKSEDYQMHYSLIGVIFHYAPSQILLDCLIERAPYSYHIEIVSKWPRFLYFAMRYWETSSFNSSTIHLKRIIETLENHYLRESLSRKYLKEAITCISNRFNISSTMFTTWPKQTNYFPG